MYITENKVTASVPIPDSYLLTAAQAEVVMAHYPWFELTINDGVVSAVTPTEPPVPVEPETHHPTIDERISALESATLDNTEMQVDLDYRLTCLALDITGGKEV